MVGVKHLYRWIINAKGERKMVRKNPGKECPGERFFKELLGAQSDVNSMVL